LKSRWEIIPVRGISMPVTLRYSSQGLWRVGFINSVQVNVWGYNIHRSVAEAIYAERKVATPEDMVG
jgi:hypothetical protein